MCDIRRNPCYRRCYIYIFIFSFQVKNWEELNRKIMMIPGKILLYLRILNYVFFAKIEKNTIDAVNSNHVNYMGIDLKIGTL
jgi:hypothetical protein